MNREDRILDILQRFEVSNAKVLFVVGPTASGKSSLGIELAKKLKGEVISCDSRQVYQGMEIGTGAVTAEEADGIPHHLLQTIDPSEPFTAKQFKEQAYTIIEDLLDKGRTPIVVGGTGLYVDALLFDLPFAEESDPKVREDLERRLEQEGHEALYKELEQVDPETASQIGSKNPRYTLRALEVYITTGTKKSEMAVAHDPKYPSFVVGLTWDRPALHTRINRRHEAMFQGKRTIVTEVEDLLSKGVPETSEALTGIGYREALDVLKGTLSIEKAMEHTKVAARRYAKRQVTWFRRLATKHPIYWVPGEELASN